MDLHGAGRLTEATAVCEQILALAPAEAGALHLLGVMAAQSGDLARAAQLLRRALEINGSSANAHFNLGRLLWQQGSHGEALASFERAIALRPGFAEAHLYRGHTLRVLERPEEALASFTTASTLRPDLAEVFCGRAAALQDLLRPEEALASYEAALRLVPDYAQARYNQGLCLLQLGRFAEGWPLAEWRRRLAQPLGAREVGAPLWRGTESLAGRKILVHPEQGLGDTLQFSRYVGPLLERGARVTLMVQASLAPLMQRSWPRVEVITESERPGSPDYHCPLLSLPLAFGTTEANMPAQVPYLAADAARTAHWRQRLGGAGFRVGICWQGRPGLIDVGRSFPPAALEPLAAVAGVRLVCLQKLEQVEPALRALAAGMRIELVDEPRDTQAEAFFDTAAMMQSLDLVVTADTAVAHLAGALGRPTWLALRRVPDWRWMLARSDTPWYPTLRLFRQRESGVWQDVFAQMARELAAQTASGATRP
jgi:tetratricopeptide (TPR) repeat protein